MDRARGAKLSASFPFGRTGCANAFGIDVGAGRLNLAEACAAQDGTQGVRRAAHRFRSHRGRGTDKTGRDLPAGDRSPAAEGNALRRRAFTSILSAAPAILPATMFTAAARTGRFAHHRATPSDRTMSRTFQIRRRLAAA